jgi:hypothetical protein
LESLDPFGLESRVAFCFVPEDSTGYFFF